MQGSLAVILMACSATAHLVITSVIALYARHQVKYLSLAWIMGIFTAMLFVATFFAGVRTYEFGMLHPALLSILLVVTFLQSVFPLSIPMPGYLQWGRMWKYAVPPISILSLYALGWLAGSRPVIVHTGEQFLQNLLSGDVLLRLVILGFSIYYILNIFALPKRLTKIDFPGYLIGYCTALGLSAIFYVVMAIYFSMLMAIIYVFLFTSLNLYLCYRTLESMALELPKPIIETVDEVPTEEEVEKSSHEDFNIANQQRFSRVEFWMQNHRDEWTDNTFGRDRLCEASGYNRHLLLQCLRSQGYNNVHDYINTYRVEELKRLIRTGSVAMLSECHLAGFGTIQTARSCFIRHTGTTLDQFLAQYSKK